MTARPSTPLLPGGRREPRHAQVDVEETVEFAAVPVASAPEPVIADHRLKVMTDVIAEALSRTHLLEIGFVRITAHPIGGGRLAVEVCPVRYTEIGERPVTVTVRVALPGQPAGVEPAGVQVPVVEGQDGEERDVIVSEEEIAGRG
ncbi:MAG: hypothetical protein ACRDTG_29270 [Pseudonocardiaceae bacterium]